MRNFLFLLLLFPYLFLQSQNVDEQKLLKKLNADLIVWDSINEDGVFLARQANLHKWGMYQLTSEGLSYKMLIYPRYDSLGLVGWNGSYAIFMKGKKYGTISSPWNDESEIGKEVLPAKYDRLHKVERGLLAAQLGEKWAYINPEDGQVLIPFIFNSLGDLPQPSYTMRKYPMDSLPQKLLKIMKNPAQQKEIDLSNLNLTFLPKELAKCVNVTSLNLEGNRFAEVPEIIGNMKKLERLYLGSNPDIKYYGGVISTLTNLKSLFIARRSSYGSTRYTTESLEFDSNLANLKSLETLAILNNFYGDDIPEFIYKLPNLKNLIIESIYINGFDKLDFNKLACKDSLEHLSLESLNNFENLNKNIHQFPKLESVLISTKGSETPPSALFTLPNLYFIRIIGWVKREGSSYSGRTVLEYDNSVYQEIISEEERREAMQKWEDFMVKVREANKKLE